MVLQRLQPGIPLLCLDSLFFALIGPCLALGGRGVLLPLIGFYPALHLGFFSLQCVLPVLLHRWVVQALGGVGPYVCLNLLPRSDEVVGGRCPDTSVVDVDARPLSDRCHPTR